MGNKHQGGNLLKNCSKNLISGVICTVACANPFFRGQNAISFLHSDLSLRLICNSI